ncbi:MAG: bifunctional homocysteine S-methyltransferase/methylenetetrahydrofolate reductase [Firmicutes bacterium]|nr:bifunctional homocysteine S-methyltransferase/methylenetetrahydrofolate reductase [Bacillota bacterium]
MGTYFAKLSGISVDRCEFSNIEAPGIIKRIHQEYIAAGAQIIKTNTFAANTISLKTDLSTIKDIVSKGFEIASRAAEGKKVYVLGDIGPIPEVEGHDTFSEYKVIVDTFIDLGVEGFIFETFSSFDKLLDICKYIKLKDGKAFILTQFAVTPEGFTRKGISGKRIIDAVANSGVIDAYGFNCLSGPMHLLKYVKGFNIAAKINTHENNNLILSVMPNAGYPTIENERTLYMDNPEYFANIMSEIRNLGVKILGGCCGTTPRHIKEMAKILGDNRKIYSFIETGKRPKTYPVFVKNKFMEKLVSGEMVLAVELDPPADAHIENMIEGAKAIRECGADIITIADCPLGRARVDSSILAAKIKREANIDTLPHIACRDRNLNAIKALLLGLHIEGIRNVLAVTGDPIPEAERNQIKGVFNFNSYMLIEFIKELNHNEFTGDGLFIGGALNVNSTNFDVELKRAKTKIQKGAGYFLTQPVFSDKGINALKEAKNTLDAKILGGILPIVSYRNANFLNNEIPGIMVPESIIKQFEGKGREEAEVTGISFAVEMCSRIIPYVDGIYLITPFNRWQMICKIIKEIKSRLT